MISSEPQDGAATARESAAAGAPRAERPRSSLSATRLTTAAPPTQLALVDEALRRLDSAREGLVSALGRDTGSIAAGHLRAAASQLEATRSHLASGRALAR